jgi:hypothetical protein
MSKKTLFVDKNAVERIDLGNDFWCEMPEAIDWDKAQEIQKTIQPDPKKTSDDFALIKELIIKWNLVEKDGKNAEVSIENIKRLDFVTIQILQQSALKRVSMDKKK